MDPVVISKDDLEIVDRRLRLFKIHLFDIKCPDEKQRSLLRPKVVAGLSETLSGYGTFFPSGIANIVADYLTITGEVEGQVFQNEALRHFSLRRAINTMKIPSASLFLASPLAICNQDLGINQTWHYGLFFDVGHPTSLNLTLAPKGSYWYPVMTRMIYDVARAISVLHSGRMVHRSIRGSSIRLVHDLSHVHPNPLIKLVPAPPMTPFGQCNYEECPHPYQPPEHTLTTPAHPSYDIYQLGLYIMEVCMQINFWNISATDRHALSKGYRPMDVSAQHGFASWMQGEYAPVELRELALTLLYSSPKDRPTIGDVLRSLEMILLQYTTPNEHIRLYKIFASVEVFDTDIALQETLIQPPKPRMCYDLPPDIINVIPALNPKDVIKGDELASGKTELCCLFKGKYLGKDVVIKEWYPQAQDEYLDERDSLMMNLSKPGVKPFHIHVYGYIDSKLWLVLAQPACNLETAFEEGKNTRSPLTTVQIMRILYDVSRCLHGLSHPTSDRIRLYNKEGKRVKHFEPVIQHRDIKPQNISLMDSWKDPLPELKSSSDIDTLPPIAVLGHEGCATTKSKSFKSGSRGDIYYMPPEAVEDGYSYDIAADIWRFGLLCYQIWTQVDFDKLTESDKERIILRRLKPKENPDAAKNYTDKWMGNGPISASAVLYEISQVGLWHQEVKYRPPVDIIVKTMRWLLEDALIADNKLPPRDPKLPKTSDPDAVAQYFGWKYGPVSTSSKLIGPRKPEPLQIIPEIQDW